MARKVWYACAHRGVSKDSESDLQKTSTTLLGCNWSAQIQRDATTDLWKLHLTNNIHNNHGPSKTLAEIPAARKLQLNETMNIITLAKSGAPPRLILITLKSSNKNNLSTSQDIYNVLKKHRNGYLDGRTPLEALLDLLKANKVFHKYELDSDHSLLRLFVALKVCITSAQKVWTGDVLLMDSA